MANAQPKKKSIGIRFRQRLLPGCHRDRIACIDVCDSSSDNNSFRARQEQAGIRQRFTPGGFTEPEGPITKFLQLKSNLPSFCHGMILELACPNSDWTNLYRCLCHGSLPAYLALNFEGHFLRVDQHDYSSPSEA